MEEEPTIGQVATQAGLGIDTIRYYERRGLVPAPPRTDGGYRIYPAGTVARLRFIRRAKELGFSLKEIKELLDLRLDPAATCAEIKNQTETKIAQIEAKIADFQRMRQVLANLVNACRGRGPVDECPILEAIGKQEGADAK
jgi:MerR family transcriptional regulator, copper efflux regulator